jgi:hypothetical protein
MELFIATLLLTLAAFGNQAVVARGEANGLIPIRTSFVSRNDQETRSKQRRTSRRRRKRNPSMPAANSTTKNDNGPVTSNPNRLEIDPGDIPPSQRPRDPNVDDRTKIPESVSPDDMAPHPKPTKQKKKRP